jgi:predicted ATP-grasp superfamily ATP-dependent carboligase
MARDRLLIVGASGRAAAGSALRAGFEPVVLDLFADADTQRLCDVRKLPMSDYPHGFVELARQLPPMPWMYTGGLENYPHVVEIISATRPLRGVLAENLETVRDPLEWTRWLEAPLAVVRPGEALPADRRWLRKPLKGAAGFGVRVTTPAEWAATDDEPIYAQEWADGPSYSALFHGLREGVELVGCSRQLVGENWLHARPFHYAGSIGPLDLGPGVGRQLDDIMEWCQTWGMIGLFGVDFILRDSQVCPVEFNPRYPASTEVYELGTGVALLGRHLREFEPAAESDPTRRDPRLDAPARVVGKAIYYAPRRLTFPAFGPWDESLARCTDVWRRPDFADLPHAGDAIAAGHPVCTVLAEGATEEACVLELMRRAAELDRLFAG